MDDDDEFGELYTDVLQSVAESVPTLPLSASSPSGRPDPRLHAEEADSDGGGGRDEPLFGSSRADPSAESPSSSKHAIAPAMAAAEDEEEDWMLGRSTPAVDPPENWDDEDDDRTLPSRWAEVGALSVSVEGEPRVLEENEEQARVSGIQEGNDGISGDGKLNAAEEDGFSLFGGGIEQNSEKLDQDPDIPGLSAGPASSGPFVGTNSEERKPSQSEEWDSDSEDDLQIVLNDSNHGPLGAERHNMVGIDNDDDDDGEEDLVIVTDEDQHHHLPIMEEQDWSEEAMQPVGDGERKEMSDVAKVTGTAGTAPGARIGYSNHGFHSQHHSMFKYVRPGATPLPGDPASGVPNVPGSARTPFGSGPIPGQGRGDWRPVAGRGFPGPPKSYNTSFGFPAWANSSARACGIGLDFTLPSHKTVFDVDIESFEEKPWRYPGVDISDFFNFGLDEDKWKDYCKRLDQLRLESTMQSKIRVYESGRSEQEYDPDLPPELAAAAGHDISADNGHGKSEGESNFTSQGRGQLVMRAPLPTGRAIQVEGGGNGERLPSIDTRPPRPRDSDTIIEIVLQDLFDDSRMYNYDPEQQEKGVARDDRSFNEAEKDDGNIESEYMNHFSRASGYCNKEMTSRTLLAMEKDESTSKHHNSKTRIPPSRNRALETHSEERLHPESSSRRHLDADEQSIDSMPSRNANSDRHNDQQKEILADCTEAKQCSEKSPVVAIDTARELSVEEKSSKQDESSIEEKSSKHDEKLIVVDSMEVEDMTSDLLLSSEIGADDNLVLPSDRQKPSSQVEHLMVNDTGYENGLQTSDNSREKSENSKDYQRQTNGEVLHEGHSSQTDYSKSLRKEDESNFRRKDESQVDDRQNREKNHTISRGKENTSNSHQIHLRGRSYERRKESESSSSSWQRREDNMPGRQIKDELTRANNDEMLLRHKNKLKVTDRNRRDEDHSRKHARDESSRHRERDDLLISRRENKDDPIMKRKRDEEYLRGKADKLDALQGHRTKEDSGRRKRERNDLHDNRKELETRMRDKTEDHSSLKHKDDNWRQNREREDRQRLKSHEIASTQRESEEGRGTVRSGRVAENKPLSGNGRNRDDSRSISYDKDYQEKERRRHNELSRRDRREDSMSQNKGRGDAYMNEKHSNADERSSRHERLNPYGDRYLTADGQQTYRERQRESISKTRDVEGKQQNNQVLGKRKHDDRPQNEKVYNKDSNKHESNISSTIVSKADPHQYHEPYEDFQNTNSSRKQGDDEPASDDENQGSRRGRSKLERWTSHKERDYDAINNTEALSTLKDIEGNMDNRVQADVLTKNEVNNVTSESDVKDDAGQVVDRTNDDQDRHLDTVAKLKKRSERFKLPMPRDKENGSNRKLDTEVQLSNNEAGVDSEIKPERPARKRRWTGS